MTVQKISTRILPSGNWAIDTYERGKSITVYYRKAAIQHALRESGHTGEEQPDDALHRFQSAAYMVRVLVSPYRIEYR